MFVTVVPMFAPMMMGIADRRLIVPAATRPTVIEVVVDGEGASRGERGEILITQLTNMAMPLIRYRLGDVAMVSEDECSCGRHGDVLDIIQGRKDDMIRTRDGRELPPELFTSTVTMPEIKGYMIIQEKIL